HRAARLVLSAKLAFVRKGPALRVGAGDDGPAQVLDDGMGQVAAPAEAFGVPGARPALRTIFQAGSLLAVPAGRGGRGPVGGPIYAHRAPIATHAESILI